MSSPLALSVVFVAHRSAAVLPAAMSSVRRQAAALGIAAEVIVVEQSEDESEVERVRLVTPDRLLVRPNGGYAAGINAGIAAARGRDLLLGNPDVELLPGALASLLDALAEGWPVVGPQFELAGALFPPAEPQTPAAALARCRALRDATHWQRHLRGELRRAKRVWDAGDPVPVPTLSGALLAVSAATARRLGPWPEDYFLYFEETEWLRRLARGGTAVAPRARVAHRWGHAADPARGDRFERARRLYFERHFPRRAGRLLAPTAPPALAAAPWSEAPDEAGWRWLYSPTPWGFPAALLPAARPVAEAAMRVCREVGRVAGSLVAWRPADDTVRGPFPLPLAAVPPVPSP